MTDSPSAASRADLRRTLTLVLLVVATALALLLGHSLERLHDATVSVTGSTVAVVTTGDMAATSGQLPGIDVASYAPEGGAELCALLAVVCAVVILSALLIARARPGRAEPMGAAPPECGPAPLHIFTLPTGSFVARSTALRL